MGTIYIILHIIRKKCSLKENLLYKKDTKGELPCLKE
jgi:hypothetical protein